jgi:hypothetical protein
MDDLRALDVRMAELLGWKHDPTIEIPDRWTKADGAFLYASVGGPMGYSKSPELMLELDAEMQRRGYARATLRFADGGCITVYFKPDDEGPELLALIISRGAKGKSEPESVARAAEAALRAEKGAGE